MTILLTSNNTPISNANPMPVTVMQYLAPNTISLMYNSNGVAISNTTALPVYVINPSTGGASGGNTVVTGNVAVYNSNLAPLFVTVTNPANGSVTVSNPFNGVVSGNVGVTGTVTVSNPFSGAVTGSVAISNPNTAPVPVTVLNPFNGVVSGNVSVAGTVAVSNPFNGVVTGSVSVSNPFNGIISGNVLITNANTAPIPVAGTVAVSNPFNGVVSGNVNITNSTAAPVPVNVLYSAQHAVTVNNTVTVTGNVAIVNANTAPVPVNVLNQNTAVTVANPNTAPIPVTVLSASGMAAPYFNTTTLGALGAKMVVPVTGLAGAKVHIFGTFVGKIKFSSTVDNDTVGPAGSRLWKAGVGSLGISEVDIPGTIDSEYRVILGGQFLVIEVTAYTSGSVTTTILADSNAPMVFVSGPVHTAQDEAVRAGRAFIASTSMQAVSAGNFLNYRFANPAGSGKNAYVFTRRFDCNMTTGTPLEYLGVSNPVALANTATTITPSNFKTGSPTASIMGVTWNMATARLDSSPSTVNPSSGVMAYASGTFVEQVRLVGPGQAFGHAIGGAGGGLGATSRVGITAVWYEEDAY